MGDGEVTKLVLVGNIPPELRSADLRAFFNEWVEGGRFCCFHYHHSVCDFHSVFDYDRGRSRVLN